jgi:hypothetical protein
LGWGGGGREREDEEFVGERRRELKKVNGDAE